jgi:hypothetical protein
MKMHHFVWMTILLFFLSYGCREKNHETNYAQGISDIVKKMTGKHIIFPDSLLQILSESGNNEFLQKDRKIISVIAGNCGSCVMTLKNWEACFREMKDQGYRNQLAFIVEDVDSVFFRRAYAWDIPPDMILIFDKNSTFSKQNGLPGNKMLKTFLVDGKNNVLLIGNPSLDHALWKLYLSELGKE